MTAPPSPTLVGDIHRRLLEEPGEDLAAAAERHVRALAPLLPADERRRVVGAALAHAHGLGPLEPLLEDPTVTEILVNAGREVWVERRGRLERGDDLAEGVAALLIERIVAPLGLRVDRSSPIVDARLADGSRVHAVIPPVAVDGPCLAIRRFAAGGVPLSAFAPAAGRRAPRRAGPPARQPRRQRRHLLGEDDVPQRAARARPAGRARRDHRGRGRAAPRHPARRPAGGAAAVRRRRRRGHRAVVGASRAPAAARPARRRRGPGRGGPRHGHGPQHGPRRLPHHLPQQQPRGHLAPHRRDGAHGRSRLAAVDRAGPRPAVDRRRRPPRPRSGRPPGRDADHRGGGGRPGSAPHPCSRPGGGRRPSSAVGSRRDRGRARRDRGAPDGVARSEPPAGPGTWCGAPAWRG